MLKSLIRLFKLTKPHLVWMSIGALLTLITVLANIALISLSGWFIAAMAAAGIAGTSLNYFTPSAIIRFLAITRTGGRYAERYITHDVTLKILSELRVWFYMRLEPLAPAHLQNLRSGDLLSRMQADIEKLDDIYLRILIPIAVAVFAIPIVFAVSYHYDKNTAWTLLAGLMITGILLPYWMVRMSRKHARQSVITSAMLRTHLIDGLQSMRELILYQADEYHMTANKKLSESLLSQQEKANQISATAQGLSVFIINLTVLLCLVLLIPQVAEGSRLNTELPMLTLLALASFEIVMPMVLAFEQMPIAWLSLQRLLTIADKTPARVEPKKSPTPYQSGICFSKVTFSYPQDDAPTLIDVSFTINKGEKVAIIGASGAGKSTVINLLLGFWQAKAGHISVFGHDIDAFQGDDLRKNIATVTQHSHFFAGTIYDNLMRANPDADQNMLDKACETAGLTEFIAGLPDGYHTFLGESGIGMSGGQKRRLALARALLKQAPLLILDEPNEGLDPMTEQAVLHNVLTKNKTVLLMTHSPVMLKNMDRIYVLEKGRMIESGNHDALLQSSPFYQNQLRIF